MFKLLVGVRLGACVKIISVGDTVGDRFICPLVGDVNKTAVGDGDRETVGDGDKATVGPTVGVTVDGKIIAGLKAGVGETIIVGLTDASLRTELFCFIKVKTKIMTIIVNKEIIKKTNLE